MNVHSHSPHTAVNRELRGKDAVDAHSIELPVNLSQSHGAITRQKDAPGGGRQGLCSSRSVRAG
eukprot:6471554-Prymnesium_polylepis.1